ncbi:MAG: FecR domain-containing protein [Sphingobacterium sp.]|jgi:ferric-dicitrate binding protein FerR (iron transport regulator)|nr:FecR domain-containing protein [Sphingobacterium sp.]
MANRKAAEILDRYNAGTATPEEVALVESWYLRYKTPPSDLNVRDLISEEELGLQRLKEVTVARRRFGRWKTMAAAAILLIGLSWLGIHRYHSVPTNSMGAVIGEKESAILTLADGKRVVLSIDNVGEVLGDEAIQIRQSAEGELTYTITGKVLTGQQLQYNTIETPKSSQYRIVLPDGSVVQLSAQSRLRYPVHFRQDRREVELVGQAYFDIATIGPEKHRTPFHVIAGKQSIEVLGTQFDVCAYEGEQFIETALLEGKVKVRGGENQVVLKPGQLVRQDVKTAKLTVEDVDVSDLQAWKEGYFIFNNDNITDIMRKLSRWYGFEVEFVGNMQDVFFQGNYLRSRDVKYLLKTLELSNNVAFEIIENKGERRVVVKRK